MVSRYLITTADERSWVFDRPVLFLGEWCRRYNRKALWSTMDAQVAEPFGLDLAHRLRNLEYVQVCYEQLIIELAEALNAFHQTEQSIRYWKIVLGHWLQRYIKMIYNRFEVLKQAINNYPINGTTLFDSENYSFASLESNGFVHACNKDEWNHMVFANILRKTKTIPLDVIVENLSTAVDLLPLRTVQSKTVKQKALNLFNKTSSRFARNTDGFIINSYLPYSELIKLHLSLKQLPVHWKTTQLNYPKPDNAMRKKLHLASEKYQGFEQFIREHIFDFIPSCYLEGYELLTHTSTQLNWPRKPKFIFTSNNFDTDELFKVWAAANVNAGIPYIVGQHGNNYGTLLEVTHVPETTTSDQFISWGWSHPKKPIRPSFILTQAGKKPAVFSQQGGVLLNELHAPHWLGPGDYYYDYGIYQDNQFKFTDNLSKKIQQQLIIRLHPAYKEFEWHEEQRWQHHNPDLIIDAGKTPIERLMNQSRLVVHSYDSTGLLECLYLNRPTLAFWHNQLDHLVSCAKPFYQLLADVGIIHFDPKKAAEFINQHWDTLQSWWQSNALQEARQVFCNEYAKTDRHAVKTLKKLLLNTRSSNF